MRYAWLNERLRRQAWADSVVIGIQASGYLSRHCKLCVCDAFPWKHRALVSTKCNAPLPYTEKHHGISTKS